MAPEKTFVGGPGNDVIEGGAGLDTIFGGDGADRINGGTGQNLIRLGRNDGDRDVVIIRPQSDAMIYEFEVGRDRIDVSAFTVRLEGNLAINQFELPGGIEFTVAIDNKFQPAAIATFLVVGVAVNEIDTADFIF